MKLRSDVKQLIQRSHWEVNTAEPRNNNSYKTKKNFTGFYTEDDPKYLKNRPLRNTVKRFLRRKHFNLSLCQHVPVDEEQGKKDIEVLQAQK